MSADSDVDVCTPVHVVFLFISHLALPGVLE